MRFSPFMASFFLCLLTDKYSRAVSHYLNSKTTICRPNHNQTTEHTSITELTRVSEREKKSLASIDIFVIELYYPNSYNFFFSFLSFLIHYYCPYTFVLHIHFFSVRFVNKYSTHIYKLWSIYAFPKSYKCS